jgi:hypothetical protein
MSSFTIIDRNGNPIRVDDFVFLVEYSEVWKVGRISDIEPVLYLTKNDAHCSISSKGVIVLPSDPVKREQKLMLLKLEYA